LPALARGREGITPKPLIPSAPVWIFVGLVPAHQEGEYLTLATTLADSTAAQGMHHSVYFVRAATSDPGLYFDSPPDSGYSLDNLAPGVPLNLALDSAASDFDYFAVYGGGSASFAAASVIGYTVSPTMDVSTDPYAYYFVTATDFSGNEGSPAVLDTSTGIVHTAPGGTLSVTCYPNPFNPTTTIEYVVPRTGRVRIDIFDASGSRVRTILDQEQEAGTYTTTWEARDDRGAPMSSGVYFLRVAQDRRERSHKLVLLK
jgi:hypothetical protein